MRTLVVVFTCIFSLNLFAAEKEAVFSAQQVSKVFTSVAKKSSPAVIYIKAEGVGDNDELLSDPFQNQAPQDPFGEDFFNRFFGSPYRKPLKQATISQGS